MKFSELTQKIGDIIPGAQFEETLDGQIIIYTNLREVPSDDGDGELIDWEESEESDDDTGHMDPADIGPEPTDYE